MRIYSLSRLWIYFVLEVNFTLCVSHKGELIIAGLFSQRENNDHLHNVGRGVRPAVELALDLVNKDTRILPNHHLTITWNDTQCDMAKATKIFFDMMDEKTTKLILFGDACSNVTGPITQISKWWNISQMSYADTDPKLSDRAVYSNFFRTIPSDSNYNPSHLALVRRFNWTRVGTIYQDTDKYSIAHNRMIKILDDAYIEVVQVESFRKDPQHAVEHLKKKDVRIIIGYFDHQMAKKVLCSAFNSALYGPKYQWIILGDYPNNWLTEKVGHKRFCPNDRLVEVIDGAFTTDALPLKFTKQRTESGMLTKEYLDKYDTVRGDAYDKHHGYAFDGIWAIATAIDRVLKGHPQKNPGQILQDDAMIGALNETNFLGVTGSVQFDGSDRIGHIRIQQYQGRKLVKVGEYTKSLDSLALYTKKLIWRGKGPPRDRNLVRMEMQRVSVPVYSCICVLAALGIIMASIFLVINIIFRDHRYIKMSSPNMNNIIIVGCMLSYISIFLLGTDGGVVSKEYVRYVCAGRSWVLAIGFSLSFGAMFSKTWRVHAIFTNIKLNKKIIKDYKLFLLVCVLVIIDAGILGTWQIVDPLGRDERNLSSQVVGDHEVVAVIEYCTSNFMEIWLGIIYAYKGLLLILGCFLAWETRRVSIPALNDSKYIGMSVYNVVIMCICGAAISFIISDQPNPSFIIISLFIIFSTTVTLSLVFVPKVIELKRDPNGEERRIRATLRKKKKKKDDQHQTLKQKMKDLAAENERFKEIIQQKAEEIRSLLEQLGDDADDLALKPCLHKKIIELRVSDMSPSRASRASSVSEIDNTSTYSETSAFTSTWAMESPRVRQRTHLHSTKSMASTDTNNTETTEFLDSTSQRISAIGFRSGIPNSSEDDTAEDEYDPFGGVYLGPAEKKDKSDKILIVKPNNHVTDCVVVRQSYGSFSQNAVAVKRSCGNDFDSIATITEQESRDQERQSFVPSYATEPHAVHGMIRSRTRKPWGKLKIAFSKRKVQSELSDIHETD